MRAPAAAIVFALSLAIPRAAAAQRCPNVMIVLDNSCSMNSDAGDGRSKWSHAVNAVNGFVSPAASSGLRFGLSLFPCARELVRAAGGNPDVCGGACTSGTTTCDVPPLPAAIVVPPGPAGATAITTTLSGSVTSMPTFSRTLGTPTDAYLRAVGLSPMSPLQDASRREYVVLITDGMGTCPRTGNATTRRDATTTVVDAMRRGSAAIRTFVIGFGAGVDNASLDAFAVAGGTARNPATCPTGSRFTTCQYYDAADEAGLHAALTAIAEAITNELGMITCHEGASDAGAPQDGGTPSDGGIPSDGGTLRDGATTEGGTSDGGAATSAGCACGVGARAHEGSAAWGLAAGMTAIGLRRRRRGRRR